jgi:hypothetical protein
MVDGFTSALTDGTPVVARRTKGERDLELALVVR